MLGQRLYAKAVGITCQEVLDNTGDEAKREAVSRLAEAFSDLEAVDPEGVYHIMTSIFQRTKQDSKLKGLLPQVEIAARSPPTSQPPTAASSIHSSPTKANAAKLVMAQNNPHLKSHRRRQSAQIPSRDSSQVWDTSTPSSRSPSKEKRMQVDAGEDESMLREMKLSGGLEHTRQLADVLFDRWCEGMRVRWPQV